MIACRWGMYTVQCSAFVAGHSTMHHAGLHDQPVRTTVSNFTHRPLLDEALWQSAGVPWAWHAMQSE
jgi:hypothetical protein